MKIETIEERAMKQLISHFRMGVEGGILCCFFFAYYFFRAHSWQAAVCALALGLAIVFTVKMLIKLMESICVKVVADIMAVVVEKTRERK